MKREEPSFSQESGTWFPWDVGRDFQEAVRRMHLGTELRVYVSIYTGISAPVSPTPYLSALGYAVLLVTLQRSLTSRPHSVRGGSSHSEWEGGRSQGISKSQKQQVVP